MPPRSQLYDPVPEANINKPRDPSERVHIDFPTVHLSTAVADSMRVAGHMTQVVGQATGHLAQSLDRLGNQVEGAGNEIFRRAIGLQELQNETAAKKASIEYDTWATQKQVEFNQLQGDAANETVLKAHMKELQDKQTEIKKKLGTDSAQRHFDDKTLPSMVNRFGSAAAHAASETRKAATGASQARVDLNGDMFSKTDDIKESQRILDETRKEFYSTLAPLKGYTKDQADAEWNKTFSKMFGSKITRFSEEDPTRALEMLNDPENKKYLTDEEYTKLTRTVTTNLRQRDSRAIGDRVQTKDPERPLEEKIDEARKEAERVNPKDPLLPDAAEERVIVKHNIYHREQREQQERFNITAREAVYGYNTPTGKKPTTKEEFDAIPGAKVAYDSLRDPQKKKAIDDALVKNSKEDYPRTPETRRRVNELKAQATSERPEDREAFIKHNFYDEKIPGEDRDALFAIQRRILEKGYKPSLGVQHARQAAIAAGMLPNNLRTWESPTLRNQFDGALLTAIEERQAANKGVPLKDADYREIVAHLLAGDPNTGFHGWFMTPRYQKVKERNADDLATLKQRYPGLSENQYDELYSQIMWKRYNKEYEEITTKPTTSPKPATGKGPVVPQSQ